MITVLRAIVRLIAAQIRGDLEDWWWRKRHGR